MHRKHWTDEHSSRCPVLLLSAKIRCCHLRNNTLLMWYEVFFWFCWCSLYGLCEVGLFHFWNLEDCLLCVFFCCFFSFCVCYLSLPLFGRRLAGGLSVNLSLPFRFQGRLLMGASTESPPRETPRWGSLGGGPLCQSPSIVLLYCTF